MTTEQTELLERIAAALTDQPPAGAAVLIPLLPPDRATLSAAADLDILLEVRALTLDVQPGEVCLPGGRIEPGESPRDAAVRETCEELQVDPDAVHVIGELGDVAGPGGMHLWAFVGTIDGYRGTFSADEVDRTFRLPLSWLLAHEPALYRVTQTPDFPDDFPWDRVPGGRQYPWRSRPQDIPFYLDTDPLVWGATARILRRFAQVVRENLLR